MRSGGLRTRISIEQNLGTGQGRLGGRVDDWQEVLSCRARVAHRSAREFATAQAMTAEMTKLIVIRYDDRIDLKSAYAMRVRMLQSDITIEILYAYDPTERRREIHIHAA